MSFLLPRALWIALAALPLIALYVLKTRRRRVRVSSAAMFVLARREATAKDPWKRLVPELALLLQLLALLALAIAFARPVGKATAIDADAMVIVIDRSASMATRVAPAPGDPKDVPATRLLRAKRAALSLLDGLGVGAEVAVVVAGRDARLACPMGRDLRAARAAIEAVDFGLVEGDLQPSLDVARDLLRARRGARRVAVFTDGALATTPTWVDEPNGPSLDLRTIDAPPPGGAREGNVGIVRVDVIRTATSTGDRVDVGVVLAAVGKPEGGRTRFLTLRRLDRSVALDAQKIEVGDEGRAAATLHMTPAADGSDELATLAIELSPNDALGLDDAVAVVVPPPRRMPVVLSSLGVGGATWIARALGADVDVKLTKTNPTELPSLSLPAWSFVVSVDGCPERVPGNGDVLIIHPPPGRCFGRTIGATVSGAELPSVTSWSPTDARLRYVDLDGIHLGQASPIAPLGTDVAEGASALGAASLARAERYAVIADASTLDRGVTIWGFDPADGELARRAAFVLMVRDAVDVARTRRDQSWAPVAHGGAAARVAAAAGAKEVIARRLPSANGTPGAIVARAPTLEGVALLEGLDSSGPFVLEGAATGAPLNVALLSESESDIVRLVAPTTRKLEVEVAAAPTNGESAPRARHDLRWLVALVATAFLAIDALWLTHRGRRVVARLARRAGAA
jgi:hypothetical protein